MVKKYRQVPKTTKQNTGGHCIQNKKRSTSYNTTDEETYLQHWGVANSPKHIFYCFLVVPQIVKGFEHVGGVLVITEVRQRLRPCTHTQQNKTQKNHLGA